MLYADGKVARSPIEISYHPAYETRWSRAFGKTCKFRERRVCDSIELSDVLD